MHGSSHSNGRKEEQDNEDSQSIVICINAIATSSNIRELLKTRKPARAVMGCEQSRFYAVVSGLILRATKKL